MTRQEVLAYVELQLKAVLGLAENHALDADKEFSLYGMNSIVSARFCHTLSQDLQQEIGPKDVLDNYTLNRLTTFLLDERKLASLPGRAADARNDSARANDAPPVSTASPAVPEAAAEPPADERRQPHEDGDRSRKDLLIGRILRALKGKSRSNADVDFSFIFFSTSSKRPFDNKYDYVVNIARYADENDFKAVWVPERHFFEFGGVFPDPALLLANIAAATSRIRLRSGSVVLPLHHSTSVAESWSMLDNLSNGRVDMAFASGWNPNDFVSSPHTYATLRETWFERMAEVERLWRGESVEYFNGKQELVPIKVYPRPVQPRLSVWMAISGNEQSFVEAGKRGYNILTMLMSKPIEELAANIGRYRRAREAAGFDPDTGVVSLMLHTFVHDDQEKVERCVNQHYFDYIKSGLKGHIQSLPKAPSEEEINRIVEHSFHYQRKNSALFGDVRHCQSVVDKLRQIGVNEVACLVDFGVTEAEMYETLPFIKQLKDAVNGEGRAAQPVGGSASTQRAAGVSASETSARPGAAGKAEGDRAGSDAPGEFAIVGLAGRYPGARSVEEFWRNLLDRRNCVSEITDERYDWRAVYGDPKTQAGKTNIRHFGLLEDVYDFDAAFFRISNREGELMDPHARLVLETVWQAIENAGLHPSALRGGKTGVFLSFYNDEYSHLLDEAAIEKSSEPYLGTALSGTIKANRISFLLGLTGPSEVYDTACSSSLVALHRAMQSIAAGDCGQAIVAGVSLLLSPARVVALSKMGILNEGNVCNPYSYPANKEVIGEGVGALLIKPLAAAQADGDFIYAVVSGSDVSHQGDASGHLTMPSAKALAELIDRTYTKLSLDRSRVSYFEGHGAGNDSDVVELMALQQCFKDVRLARPLALGSVKSNIGFGEASGGIAQLTKCALSLHYGIVPATLHFTQCDPSFDLGAANIEVLGSHKTLAADSDHYVSVLAYGLGGTNAHVVLRNYRGEAAPKRVNGDVAGSFPAPMIFSAGSAAALTQYVQAIYRHLSDSQVRSRLERRFASNLDELLPALARTLIGRERHAAHRVAFLAPTYDALLDGMIRFLEVSTETVRVASSGETSAAPASVIVRPSEGTNTAQLREFLEICREQKRIDKLAMIWVNGVDVDWRSLYEGRHQRIALPPPPFAGKELRLVNLRGKRSARDAQRPAASNASRLRRVQTATGVEASFDVFADDYFVREHVVDGRPVLPGVAYLAVLAQIAQEVFELPRCFVKSIAWLTPFDLAGAPFGTMQFYFDRQGHFRVMHLQRQVLCCKGQMDISGAALSASVAAADVRPQLASSELADRIPLLDRESYWALVNSPEAKQAHGPSMRTLAAIYPQGDACVAVLNPASRAEPFSEIPLFDGALGAIVGLAIMSGEPLAPSVPFSIDAFQLWTPIGASEAGDWRSQPLYAVLRRRDGKLPRYDITIESAGGHVIALFKGYFAKTFQSLPAVDHGAVPTRAASGTAAPRRAAERLPVGDPSLRERLVDEFHKRIAAFLKVDLDLVPIDGGLEALGLDSIGVNEITEQLSQALGFELPATLMFEYPSIGEMVDYLVEDFAAELSAALGAARDSTAASTSAAAAAVATALPTDAPLPVRPERSIDSDAVTDDIAVVGIGGRFPGSLDVHGFWRQLAAGHDFISEMPAPRSAAIQALFSESMAALGALYGGFVADADSFDAEFFGLSDEEALAMDPQQRLFMVACWQALEDAGYFPRSLAGKNIGVYVGAIANEYVQTATLAGFTSVHSGTGSALSGIANRSSYFFDFNGPSQSIDAACCSSLYALDRAVKDIKAGVCEAALVGGVSYIGTPDGFVAYAGMNYLAKDWRCKAFADGGDGWSKGELFAAVFVKPYRQALADNDPVYAVITGSGVNHGGRSHFYEQPNSNRHAELVARVYREGRLDPANLVHIEAHGTGTEMGDALEFNVLQKVLRGAAKEQGMDLPAHSCALGSIKSNIGHTEAAAGIAGFIKTVLLLQHRTIPPSLHIAAPNKHLRLEKSALYLAKSARELPRNDRSERLYASVHSFNFSGAAAHVLAAEAVHPENAGTLGLTRYPVCLSARSTGALRAYLGALIAHIESDPALSLDSLVYTINNSKSYFSHRLGAVVGSIEDLLIQWRRALNEFAELEQRGVLGDQVDSVRYSATQSKTTGIGHYPQLTDLTASTLVTQWLDESRFSWSEVLAPFAVAKLHLPAYPFVDQRLYFAGSGVGSALARDASANREQERGAVRANIVQADSRSVHAVDAEGTQSALQASARPAEQVRSFVRDAIAQLFSLPPSGIDLDTAISTYPFESITLVRLCDNVNRVFGLQTTPPDYFALVTLNDIAAFIEGELRSQSASSATTVASGAESTKPTSMRAPEERTPEQRRFASSPKRARADGEAGLQEAIAIIGMSGEFPGAPDIASFWQVLSEGRDCISEIPSSRWDWRTVASESQNHDGVGAAKWGGFIAGMAEFDPLFFGISPREAEMMDPQQRLLLTHTWQAIEDAGYAPTQLAGSNTAIFVGVGASGFEQVLSDAGVAIGGHAATGLAPSIGPNRVSFVLDLHGPSEPVDTACSSSLVAVHRAAQCLRNGDSDLALAGGVNTLISSVVHVSLNSAGMLATDGRCKTFSDKADGYVRGEGVGILVLKRLSDAQRSRDHIYAVIRGSAENHGGRASSLTAPNPNAQAQLLVSAYRSAGVDPRTVTYIETHGTGTKLGDPIEINGLKSAFKTLQGGARVGGQAYCGLGSVKTNIGHLEYAAGVAGVIKVLLQMRHRQLVKSLHSEVINPYIALSASPFYVVQSIQPWESLKDENGAELPRRAGVSSFGFGGANAHVVLEEYSAEAPQQPAAAPADAGGASIFVLSGRSEEQLRQQAQRLSAALEAGAYQESDLARIAYTLQVGRDAMEHRAAFVAENLARLNEALKAVASNATCALEIFRGKREDNKEALDVINADQDFHDVVLKWLATGRVSKLLALWVRGLSFDWSALYQRADADHLADTPQRISLPTYPFRKQIYWVKTPSAPAVSLAKLAPLEAVTRTASASADASRTDASPSLAKPKVSLQQLSPVAAEREPSRSPAQSLESTRTAALRDASRPATDARSEGSTPARSQAEAAAILKATLSAALYIPVEELSISKTFAELGLDSVLAVEWVRRINQELAIEMPVAKLYDHPTLAELAEFVHGLAAARTPSGEMRSYELGASARGVAEPTTRAVGAEIELRRAAPSRDEPVAQAHSSSPAPEALMKVLRESLAAALYVDAAEISANKPFVELGLDSVIAVEWMRHLNQRFGINLPVIKLYDCPNIVALAGCIADVLKDTAPLITASAELPQSAPTEKMAQAEGPGEHAPHGLVITGVRTLAELEIAPWTPSAPAPGEISIEVRASAINFPDTLCVNGLYPTMPSYPFVPGFEVAGVVTAVGAGVNAFSVGDDVIALTGEQLGGHAQAVNVSSRSAVLKPANISFEEACSMPVAFGTVYSAFALGQLRKNEHVLIHTATGGCGLAALQLARLLGCVCYGTSSRDEKLEVLRRLQTPHALNYRGPFDQEIKRVTGGRGVDVVLNMVAGEAMQRGLNSLAPSGRYLELAVHALKAQRTFDLSHLVDNQAFLSMDFRRLSMSDGAQEIGPVLQAMVRLLESEQIVPIVSRIYPFAQIKEALAYVGKGAHIGKVVISHQVDRMVDCEEQCLERLLAQHRRAERQPLPDSVFRLGLERSETSREPARAPAFAATAARVEAVSAPARNAIAVIGMAGQFPQAPDLAAFWRNIAEGRDCISEVPDSRWSTQEFYDADRQAPGKSYCKWMGVIEDADKFDPLFFSISPAEAKLMDPQQRLFLQACWRSIEDAGVNPESLSGSRCGVFVGCTQGVYGQSDASEDLDAQGLMGGNSAILAARISYFLNLKGPSLAIDTACSSSLVAINEACNYLQLGKVDLALAGGVSVLAGPSLHIMTSKAGMLSPRGRCFTFDSRADGFVPGEGVGVLLLKNLAQALADGDPIHGVLRGWGANQDGKTNGITAPSPGSQVQLQKQVFEEFNVSPETITLVEAHGTGTKLGDPIEVGALIESFRAFTTKQHYCALGSVKSNIGHTMSAAGVSGVIKALLALKHQQLPPTVQFKQLNEHIPLEGSPFVINTELRPWRVEDGAVRRAAVSSFSFSGTNAHVILEEAPARSPESLERGARLILLSARTATQLRQQADQLADHVEANPRVSLSSVSYTLLTGRKHFAHRLAAVVANAGELIEALREWSLSGQSQQVSTGHCREPELKNAKALPSVAPSGATPAQQAAYLKELGQRFCRGEDLRAEEVLAAWADVRRRPRRISLPTYPFARDSYWIAAGGAPVARSSVEPAAKSDEHERALPEASVEERKQWVFIAEQQVLEPLPRSLDWREALRSAAANKLLIISADEEERSSLMNLLRRMEQSVGTPLQMTVQTMGYADLSVETLQSIPDVVIMYGPSGRAAEAPRLVDEDVKNVVDVCRLFMRKAWDSGIEFYYVYESDEQRPALAGDALAGFLSSATLENSRHRWKMISYDGLVDSQRKHQIVLQEWLSRAVIGAAPAFVDVRYRDSQRWLTKLQAVDVAPGEGSIFKERGAYLIAGGLGPMGMLVCAELARRYRARLVIFSRSAVDAERQERINTLQSLGATVHYFPVDITDQPALAKAYRSAKAAVGDLHGVLLLANQVQDGIIANKSWESFASETATKTKGTVLLDQLTADEPLDFFLLFSSIAAYGLAGSAGYSYSSAFQNGFAKHRNGLRKAGLRSGFTLSYCWGPWTIDYYLRQSHGEDRSKKFTAQGTDLITIGAAFPLIESRQLSRYEALGVVAVSDAEKFRSLMMLTERTQEKVVAQPDGASRSAWFAGHLTRWEKEQACGKSLSVATVEETIPLEEIRRLPPELIRRLYKLLQAEEQYAEGDAAASHPGDAHEEIVEAIAEAMAAVLELTSVAHDEPFQNYGLDSIVAMKLVTRLEKRLNMSIEPKWLIDFPTINSLAAHLTAQESMKATT